MCQREKNFEVPDLFSENIVWEFQEGNLNCYNVYGIAVTNRGTILAFAEGRLERWDASPHHIVLKRSTNQGMTWQPTHILVESGHGECYCNPTPLVERHTGKTVLFYARNYAQALTKVCFIVSLDDGVSWSAPTEVTRLFDDNPHDWTFHLPGPGHGIQLKSGRLMLQIWHRRTISFPVAERRYGLSVIYSDDAGETWHHGGDVPLHGQLNESRIAQLSSGELLLNARSGPFVTSGRYLSRSRDEGRTWTPPQLDPSLPPSYATDSGLISLAPPSERKGNLMLFSRPAHEKERRNLEVNISNDEGKTWQFGRTVYGGAAHYSDMVVLPNAEVGLLYGRGSIDPHDPIEGNVREVAFARFNLAWLTKTEN